MCTSTMSMGKKVGLVVLVTLLVFITVHRVDSSQVLTASDESDEENTLRQALYLVKLLKTDYMKSLRENNELEPVDESNTTCPEDAANSTTPINLGSIAESVSPTIMMATPAPPRVASYDFGQANGPPVPVVPFLQPGQPAQLGPVQPGPPQPLFNAAAPANYPPQPIIQYTPPGVLPPAENVKYPYRFYNRRTLPDYGYYDVLIPRYRSQKTSHSNQNVSATTPVLGFAEAKRQIPMTRDIKQLELGLESPYLESRYAHNIKGPYRRNNYYDPAMEVPIQTGYRRVGGADPVADISSSSLVPEAMTRSQPTTVSASITTVASTTDTTEIPVPVTKETEARQSPSSSPETIITTITQTKKITHRTATTKAHSRGGKKPKTRIPHRPKTTEAHSKTENILLSQVATELMNEINKTKPENTSAILRRGGENVSFKSKQTTQLFKSTLKIYLKGSSKFHIPLPENNAYCHLYPQSKLCSSGI